MSNNTHPSDFLYRSVEEQRITKREYFAAMALQGIIASPNTNATWEKIAEASVRVADLLIGELNKPVSDGKADKR